MSGLIVNSGDLLDLERVPGLIEETGLDEGELRKRFTQFRECLERRRGMLGEESSATDVSFFLLGRMLHILGYTHSHSEQLPGHHDGRVDYTLFSDATDFQNSMEERGTATFFRSALALVKAEDWESDLKANEEGIHPAEDLDEILRTTAQQWAILTNGSQWRLYHRNTVTMLNTFFEVNLREALETNDFETFRIFAGIFSREALLTDGSGTSPVRRVLT